MAGSMGKECKAGHLSVERKHKNCQCTLLLVTCSHRPTYCIVLLFISGDDLNGLCNQNCYQPPLCVPNGNVLWVRLGSDSFLATILVNLFVCLHSFREWFA